MRVLRAAERIAQPWKNGGGMTCEVIAHPPGGGPGEFDWRVSIAQVRAAGPFSHFPGIERRMAVLEGELVLRMEEGARVLRLSPGSAPIGFAGEAAVSAEPRGPVTDLNIMVRRGRFACALERHVLAGAMRLAPRNATRVVIALADLTVRSAAEHAELTPLDALLIEEALPCELSGRRGSALYVAEIFPSAD
jgi:environmental stress-induced protein Ves